jgi:RHS repeat-associated protein
LKSYELTNHLGNVLATITDKKIAVPSSGNSSLIDHYTADVVTAQDYYPFGMIMPGRSFVAAGAGNYRYGFNGKEQDPEVKGTGNQYDYGFRIYDPRIGRFLSVDPLRARYPWNSPYAFAENDVLRAIDLDGAEHKIVIHWIDKKQGDGALHISKTSVNINQNESFDGWGQPSTASKSSGSVFALTETYYYMMSENKLYKGKDFLENANVNSVNPPPSAQYDYSPNVMENKAADDAKWAGWNPVKWTRLVFRDAAAPDNARTVEDVKMGMLAFTSVVGAPGMLRGMLKTEGIAVNGVNSSVFSEENISIVTEHLKQFGERAENKVMLERMNNILNGKLEATEIDRNFIAHELREQELEAGGMAHGPAHEQVLKEQNMYHRDYEQKLYTKEALDVGNKQMEREQLNK